MLYSLRQPLSLRPGETYKCSVMGNMSAYETRDGFQQFVGMVSVWAVPAVRQNYKTNLALAATANRVKLTRCSIGIVLSLNQEYRYVDLRKILLDVPRTK